MECLKKSLLRFLALLLSTGVMSHFAFAQSEPGLSLLSQSGYIMGPGNGSYLIHDNWKRNVQLMKTLDILDQAANRIEEIVCSNQQNKSILVVGEPSLAYLYLFARVSGGRADSLCPTNMWHVDVNISKIESGHMYVGQVDEYWNANILAPSDKKNVVLYFQSIGNLIGIGSHSNDDTGIEREYVANITAGRMRSVAFVDKYEYNDIIRSKHAYVLESFADKIILPSITPEQTVLFAKQFMRTLYPNVKIGDNEISYITKNIAYYQPNRQEPDRTLSVLNNLIKGIPGGLESKPSILSASIETNHPYGPNANQEWIYENKEYNSLQVEFAQFDLEDNYDFLYIYDNTSGGLLAKYSGKLAVNAVTPYYQTNSLKFVLKSDPYGNSNQGFSIKQIYGKKITQHEVSREQARKALLNVAQVPAWIVDRNYSVVKDLEGKLNADVVGVTEGKRDLVRLAKNGYVAGRTDDKPIGTILFTGPTGTGKSYIAKKMAEFMGLKLVTLDMTIYKEPSSFKTFQEVMARNLTNTPYAMYLFEEIDKASIEVLDQLYFMMDEGVFYDPYQRPLFARGAFIMMTTNAASDTILNNANSPDLRNLVMADLKKSFRMSFINRFDAISIFKPFTQAEFSLLADTLVAKKVQKMKEIYIWNAVVDRKINEFIAQKGQSPEFGARPMERLVEVVLGGGIAEYQMQIQPLLDNSQLNFTKDLTKENGFVLESYGKSISYEIDPVITKGKAQILPAKLEKFFETIRQYND